MNDSRCEERRPSPVSSPEPIVRSRLYNTSHDFHLRHHEQDSERDSPRDLSRDSTRDHDSSSVKSEEILSPLRMEQSRSPHGSEGRVSSKSPERSFHEHSRFSSKDHTSPPNVTVVQPSVTHPIFPYLYPYHSSASSIPYPMSHLFSGNATLPHALPFLSTSGHTDISSHLPHTHAHALSALSQLPFHGHPLLQSSYSSLSPSVNGDSALSPPSSLGPIFPSRTSPRFTPYSLPTTNTTMVTSTSPVAASGLHISAHSTSPSHSSSVGVISRPSPIRPRSPLTSRMPRHISQSTNPNSEIKSIERMLNGLERKRLANQERQSIRSDN